MNISRLQELAGITTNDTYEMITEATIEKESFRRLSPDMLFIETWRNAIYEHLLDLYRISHMDSNKEEPVDKDQAIKLVANKIAFMIKSGKFDDIPDTPKGDEQIKLIADDMWFGD